ncbi:MAG: glycyl-radical enzyme activating protein [Treponema sp.]|nr:glycyl-radical enzyme activating protein [Treponema sp.]
MTATGRVFKIQRWSIHDGDGIRSAVFFKGCPMRCAWCANPESWARPDNPDEVWELDRLMHELRRDEVFYRESGGGISFSGGEPFAQPAFLRAVAEACAERGYGTAVETSALFNWEECGDIVPLLGTVFADIKHMDAERHKRYTGSSNEKILENIGRIIACHPNVIIRLPLIAGVNDNEAHLEAVCSFILTYAGKSSQKVPCVELLPYHDLGLSKYAALGVPPPHFATPPRERIETFKRLIQNRGLCVLP